MDKLTRRTSRENAFLAAFASTFDNAMPEDVINIHNEVGENTVDKFGRQLIDTYYEHSAEVNDVIRDHLKGWTIDRIPRVSLTVLRLSLSELLYSEEKIPSVIINEAVELTKKFGGDDDYQFVNGLLGSVVREMGLDKSAADTKE